MRARAAYAEARILYGGLRWVGWSALGLRPGSPPGSGGSALGLRWVGWSTVLGRHMGTGKDELR